MRKTHGDKVIKTENVSSKRSKRQTMNCEECDFSTRFQNKMKAHKVTVHTELRKCKFCPYQTRFKLTLQRHKKTEHPQKNYNCESCDYKTTNKAKLQIHLQIHLTAEQMQSIFCVCDECGQSFKSEMMLRNHRIMDHNDAEIVPSMIPCDHCDLFLESDVLLKIHRETVHEGKGVKLQACQYCKVPMKRVANHERSCVFKDKQARRSKLFQDDSFGWI